MSSAEYITATIDISQVIPFDIEPEDWENLSGDKRHWWLKIYKAWGNINPRYKVSYEYSSLTNQICFIFRSKNKVYKNLLKSLMTYGNAREKYYSELKSYYLKIMI